MKRADALLDGTEGRRKGTSGLIRSCGILNGLLRLRVGIKLQTVIWVQHWGQGDASSRGPSPASIERPIGFNSGVPRKLCFTAYGA